jgi:hypothetical protein
MAASPRATDDDGEGGRVEALERENGELRAQVIDLQQRIAVMVGVGTGGLN